MFILLFPDIMKVPYKIYYTGTFVNCQGIGKLPNAIVTEIRESHFYFSELTAYLVNIAFEYTWRQDS